MNIERILEESESRRVQREQDDLLKRDQEVLRQQLNGEKVEKYLMQVVKPILHQVQADLLKSNRKCELNIFHREAGFKSFVLEVRLATDRFPLNGTLRSWIKYEGQFDSAVIEISTQVQNVFPVNKELGTFTMDKISKEIVESCMEIFLREVIC